MNLTQEQEKIVDAVKNSEDEIIKVNAFAGTGKTTTLVEISKAIKDSSILYLAFNKSIQIEAQKRFPRNVKVKTTHSLAYYYIVVNFSYKVRHIEYRAFEIADFFKIENPLAKLVEKNFKEFCNSSSLGMKLFIELEKSQKRYSQQIIEYSLELFNLCLQKKLDLTHNIYLKIFQLMLLDNQLSIYQFDIIMLDEAQDINDVTISIFHNLSAEKKIIVGDIHQQIYSFRGSINAMQKIKATTFYLTTSFRFNNILATRASKFLYFFKGEKNRLKGEGKSSAIITKAYISRSNIQLIDIIFSFIREKKFFKTIRDPYLIFALPLNILNLLEKKRVEKKFLYLKRLYNDYQKSFKEGEFLGSLLSYLEILASKIKDIELQRAVEIVGIYKEELREIYKITLNNFHSPQKADIFLTTAHTSKGLDFDEVNLLGFEMQEVFLNGLNYLLTKQKVKIDQNFDFVKFWQQNIYKLSQQTIDEFNLYYVAITRAKSIVKGDYFYEVLESLDREILNKELFKIFSNRRMISIAL